ncbi:MAG: hypothetical protein IPN97_07570 [Saprospiraceae bacterium]|nr:hypothetical protein [Saprospiraceae bacterium]MBK9043050.1 hypothetical protein [Saprospiraceae bacterium]
MNRFFLELIKRWLTKKPWFFKTVQIVTSVTAVILLAPQFLTAVQEGGFSIPETWNGLIQQIVGYALAAQALVVQLTTTSKDKEDKEIKD